GADGGGGRSYRGRAAHQAARRSLTPGRAFRRVGGRGCDFARAPGRCRRPDPSRAAPRGGGRRRNRTAAPDDGIIVSIARELTGEPPREVRLVRTDEGLLVFVTLRVAPDRTLAEAHARASEVEERIREELPEIADVVVHTEP